MDRTNHCQQRSRSFLLVVNLQTSAHSGWPDLCRQRSGRSRSSGCRPAVLRPTSAGSGLPDHCQPRSGCPRLSGQRSAGSLSREACGIALNRTWCDLWQQMVGRQRSTGSLSRETCGIAASRARRDLCHQLIRPIPVDGDRVGLCQQGSGRWVPARWSFWQIEARPDVYQPRSSRSRPARSRLI